MGCHHNHEDSEESQTLDSNVSDDERITYETGGRIIYESSRFYKYQPLNTITSYELSLLLPLFSGSCYGFGEYSTGGSLLPIKDRNKGGWPVDNSIAIFRLNEYELKKLGSAKRHLVELP